MGHSVQKFLYLPESIGDSIFAITAEELGLVGAIGLIALFLVFAFRGFRIAKNAPDNFSLLLAGGMDSNRMKSEGKILKDYFEYVDVNSGVEDQPGVKDENKIMEFMDVMNREVVNYDFQGEIR